MAADERFDAALRAVAAALGEIPAPSMIIGGVAVIAAGVPRQTIDIDATILGRETTAESVLGVFSRHGIQPRIDDALAFARQRQVLLLIHSSSAVTIEVSFAWLPFEQEALANAVEIDIGGSKIRVARPEDLIVYKAAAWRDRDRSDIQRLLIRHLQEIDVERVRRLVHEIAIALDDPGRGEAFEALVAAARERG
jgi:hypothetical protein